MTAPAEVCWTRSGKANPVSASVKGGQWLAKATTVQTPAKLIEASSLIPMVTVIDWYSLQGFPQREVGVPDRCGLGQRCRTATTICRGLRHPDGQDAAPLLTGACLLNQRAVWELGALRILANPSAELGLHGW